MFYYITLGFGVIISMWFCIQRTKGFSVGNVIFKAVSSLCYVFTGIIALFVNQNAFEYGLFIVFGGVLGLCGDIVLDLKGTHEENMKTYMNAGFLFFLVGHFFYTVAIILSMRFKWWIVLLCAVGSLLFSLGNILTEKLMNLKYGSFKGIVFIYVAFLVMTTSLSVVALFMSHFELKYIWLSAGAILFTLSDVVLSSTYFGVGKDKKFHFFINHFLYYAGQYMIALSIFHM